MTTLTGHCVDVGYCVQFVSQLYVLYTSIKREHCRNTADQSSSYTDMVLCVCDAGMSVSGTALLLGYFWSWTQT